MQEGFEKLTTARSIICRKAFKQKIVKMIQENKRTDSHNSPLLTPITLQADLRQIQIASDVRYLYY